MLFLFSGQVGCNQSMYLKNLIQDAYANRFNICMVSFRGQSEGGKLVTPKLYNALSVEDIREPMFYVKEKYLKGKAYACGCSMGANILANYLGMYPDEGILSGAVCIQAGIKKWEGAEYFRTSLGGIYNRAMGKYQFNYLRANLDLL